LITEVTRERIGKYLYFRHFFTHAYGFMLDESQLQPLIDNIFSDYALFKREIENYLSGIHQ